MHRTVFWLLFFSVIFFLHVNQGYYKSSKKTVGCKKKFVCAQVGKKNNIVTRGRITSSSKQVSLFCSCFLKSKAQLALFKFVFK